MRYASPALSASTTWSTLDPEGVGHAGIALVVVVARPVQRHGAVGGGRLAGLQDLLGGGADLLGELGHRRRAAELAAQFVADPLDADGQLLEVARDADRPALVAEVPLELTEDGRHGERRERGLAGGIEAVDGLQQSERSDLDEVVELLAAVLVAARQLAGEREEAIDQRLSRGRIAVLVQAHEQPAVLAGAGQPIFGKPGP